MDELELLVALQLSRIHQNQIFPSVAKGSGCSEVFCWVEDDELFLRLKHHPDDGGTKQELQLLFN